MYILLHVRFLILKTSIFALRVFNKCFERKMYEMLGFPFPSFLIVWFSFTFLLHLSCFCGFYFCRLQERGELLWQNTLSLCQRCFCEREIFANFFSTSIRLCYMQSHLKIQMKPLRFFPNVWRLGGSEGERTSCSSTLPSPEWDNLPGPSCGSHLTMAPSQPSCHGQLTTGELAMSNTFSVGCPSTVQKLPLSRMYLCR